jgi:hypothetical protein
MALSNDMTLLLDKIERRLGLIPLSPHLPKGMQKADWADEVIMKDTIVEFSRFFPNRFKLVINDETCNKQLDPKTKVMWYYIKDEILLGNKLLGIKDIDWTDTSSANSSLTNGSIGNYYYPSSLPCPAATYETMLSLQMAADFASLYNRGIVVEFEYPNRFCLKGLGNANYDLTSFVVVLLLQHNSLATISPTMMTTFENLAMADVANYLYMNLRYYDNFETAYVNIDLKLNELQDIANKRDAIIEELDNAHVSAANPEIPYVWTV